VLGRGATTGQNRNSSSAGLQANEISALAATRFRLADATSPLRLPLFLAGQLAYRIPGFKTKGGLGGDDPPGGSGLEALFCLP
jgi:hypothetical protein